MSAIQPTSGIRPPMVPLGTPVAGRQQPPVQRDFAQVLKSYVGAVDQKQQASYAAIKDLIAGKTDNVLPAVHAMAKADLSFKLLMGVRNKVIEAYKQTMNMQV